jgi:hypothetical protein
MVVHSDWFFQTWTCVPLTLKGRDTAPSSLCLVWKSRFLWFHEKYFLTPEMCSFDPAQTDRQTKPFIFSGWSSLQLSEQSFLCELLLYDWTKLFQQEGAKSSKSALSPCPHILEAPGGLYYLPKKFDRPWQQKRFERFLGVFGKFSAVFPDISTAR